MNIPSVLGSPAFRQAWKGAEILFVLGLRGLSSLTGRPARRRTRDRRVLDEEILPRFVADPACHRVLFVGCDWYTRHYETMFAGRDYWTLELDSSRAGFGGSQHVVGDLRELSLHFPDGGFDLIVCNGVIGWGLNEPAEVERAMAACARALAPGGCLVIGWNDVPEKTPIAPGQVEALRELHPFPGPLGQGILTDTYNRHSFVVLQRGERPRVTTPGSGNPEAAALTPEP